VGAGWVAGAIRARALVSRCAGASAGRELAACATLELQVKAVVKDDLRIELVPALGRLPSACDDVWP
jgi:hypothetical protein